MKLSLFIVMLSCGLAIACNDGSSNGTPSVDAGTDRGTGTLSDSGGDTATTPQGTDSESDTQEEVSSDSASDTAKNPLADIVEPLCTGFCQNLTGCDLSATGNPTYPASEPWYTGPATCIDDCIPGMLSMANGEMNHCKEAQLANKVCEMSLSCSDLQIYIDQAGKSADAPCITETLYYIAACYNK